MENTPQDNNELDSLEDPGTVVSGGVSPESNTPPIDGSQPDVPAKKPKISHRIQGLISKINIYLLLFILILVLSGGLIFTGVQRNKKVDAPTSITTQPLTKEQLAQLSGTETKVGDPKQTLTIESNAIFTGKVLVRDSLDVAGSIKVGGALSLAGLTVAGTSSFDEIQTNKLAVANDVSINGQLTVQKGLTVTGGGSFGGPISAPSIVIQTMQLSGDLQLNRHIDTGGVTPGKSDGTALGSGGTSSVGGSDTAGTVTINTGGGPAAGCFITVNFTQKFNATPHVVITPVGSAAAGLNYYINRSTTSFSVCSTNAAPAGQTFSFDYVAFD